MKERISGVVCTMNEESNIADCLSSLKGVDEMVVADDGSSDRTMTIAKSLGARVFRRADHSETVTEQQVRDFKARFGWAPSFIPGDKIRNGHKEYQEAIDAASHDWVVIPDADERITWDLPKLRREVLPEADQVISEFVHSHDEEGNPVRMSNIIKMFRKSVTHVEGRTHGVILPCGRMVETKLMRVDHYQKPGHSQAYVLPIMEYSVLVDDDQRSRFYLGRQYYYHGQFDHALDLLHLYLKDATWQPEIEKARIYEAQCYWNSGRGDEAREACLQAVLLNPDDSEALSLMSELYFEPWKSKWSYIASNARNEGVLF